MLGFWHNVLPQCINVEILTSKSKSTFCTFSGIRLWSNIIVRHSIVIKLVQMSYKFTSVHWIGLGRSSFKWLVHLILEQRSTEPILLMLGPTKHRPSGIAPVEVRVQDFRWREKLSEDRMWHQTGPRNRKHRRQRRVQEMHRRWKVGSKLWVPERCQKDVFSSGSEVKKSRVWILPWSNIAIMCLNL